MLARLLLILLAAMPAIAQVCRLSVAGLNRNRRVEGDIAVECPDPLHSAPFGNWGVNSNFGPRRNGHQFDGWCHDARVCDNNGLCFQVCRDGWYEWNSCTTHARFKAPNCELFNSQGCTAQQSTQGINVLATQTIDVPVTCPRLAPDGATHDAGGCLDLRQYERTDNFMSLYELDPLTGDELVQTIQYPPLTVRPQCNVWGCASAGSDWVDPIAWASPASPAKVFAEMAMIVNSGTFVDSANVCRAQPVTLEAVSSASYNGGELAADSLVSLFTSGVTLVTDAASTQPPPTTLAGLQVRVTTATAARLAAITYVSPSVINAVLPAGLPEGEASVAVVAGGTIRAEGVTGIGRVSPALFSADASGRGPAAATVARGGEPAKPTYECGGEPRECRAIPVDLAAAPDDAVVSVFATGIRGRTDRNEVTASLGGLELTVDYAGAHTGSAGLDRIDLRLPPDFPARGLLDLVVTAAGKPANIVTLLVQ